MTTRNVPIVINDALIVRSRNSDTSRDYVSFAISSSLVCRGKASYLKQKEKTNTVSLLGPRSHVRGSRKERGTVETGEWISEQRADDRTNISATYVLMYVSKTELAVSAWRTSDERTWTVSWVWLSERASENLVSRIVETLWREKITTEVRSVGI